MNPFDTIRVINVTILSLILIGLIVSAFVYRRYPLNLKGVGLFLFGASGLYSSVEVLLAGVPGGPRSVTILFVALIALIIVYGPLAESFVSWFKKRRPKKS